MVVELLTVSAYARHRGCDEKAVRKAIDEGRISAVERDGKRLIDPAVADIQWEKNTRARVSKKAAGGLVLAGEARDTRPPAGDPDYLSYQAARAMRENEEAMTARLERLELERKLTDVDGVARAVWTAFRMLRDTAMPLGRSVSGRVAAMSDAREIELLIDEEMRTVLTKFRDGLLAKLVVNHGGGAAPPADLTDDVTDADG